MLSLIGCTQGNKFGPCVGLMDTKDPKVKYQTEYWNLFVGMIFIETFIVPVVVIASSLQCPVDPKE